MPEHPEIGTLAAPLLSQRQKDEAKRLGVPALLEDDRTGVSYVLIPGGRFTMGSMETSDSEPPHAVMLAPHYLAVTEITNAQFQRFADATGYRTTAEKEAKGYPFNPAKGEWEETSGVSWRQPLFGGQRQPDWEKHPVVQVSRDDAIEYARWAKGSLPSEAQLEHALRGEKDGEKYPWGSVDTPPAKYGNYRGEEFKRAFPKTPLDVMAGYDDGFAGTAPVASFTPDAYGLRDVSGNVWEWCADDFHDTYAGAPTDGSAWVDDSRSFFSVFRGGGWNSPAGFARSAMRAWGTPGLLRGDLGFRLAKAVTAR